MLWSLVNTVTEFLLARVSEDEAGALARAQLGGVCSGCEHTCGSDAERTLAEANAKREVVDLISSTDSHEIHPDAWTVAKWAARLLAFPYADHPDYREEWKP